MVVNVASCWGKTSSEYKGLNQLYSTYSERGFDIIAFPSGQFLNQEYNTDEEIKQFTQSRGVQFNVMRKIDVNGSGESSVYSWLKNQPNCSGGIYYTVTMNTNDF